MRHLCVCIFHFENIHVTIRYKCHSPYHLRPIVNTKASTTTTITPATITTTTITATITTTTTTTHLYNSPLGTIKVSGGSRAILGMFVGCIPFCEPRRQKRSLMMNSFGWAV